MVSSSAAGDVGAASSAAPTSSDPPPPAPGTQRHTLPALSELRLEIPFPSSSSSSAASDVAVTLQSGTAEIFGAELASSKPYTFAGTKIAIFTWHGCVIDVADPESKVEIVYVSEETECNVAAVNTHAQLEVMRDDALGKLTKEVNSPDVGGGGDGDGAEGPRVMLVGPADCGKTSLARVLTAYAVKLGRSPILIDLDPTSNMLSVPGTISASPMTPDSTTAQTHGLASSSIAAGTTPLVLWYGSMDLSTNPDLYKAQLDKLGRAVDERLKGDAEGRSSGFIVNTSGWIEDIGFKLLLHAADALRINVILVLGHDRLYSMLNTHFSKKHAAMAAASTEKEATTRTIDDATASTSKKQSSSQPKVIKLPRSGGVVSRDAAFRRQSRSQCIKRYFNGDVVRRSDGSAPTNQYTPFLLEISFSTLQLHKLSSVSLSASMLPVSAKQSTDPVQLDPVEVNPALKHAVLAVCHPNAVESNRISGRASDLYLSGVAGFVAVEEVNMEREIVSLLSPCSGELPSTTLLCGDITWME